MVCAEGARIALRLFQHGLDSIDAPDVGPKGKSVVHQPVNIGRLDQAKAAFKAMGAEIKQFYLVVGQYDIVIVSEAPDDQTMAKAALTVGAGGSIRTQTLRAFTEEEYRKIVAALS